MHSRSCLHTHTTLCDLGKAVRLRGVEVIPEAVSAVSHVNLLDVPVSFLRIFEMKSREWVSA